MSIHRLVTLRVVALAACGALAIVAVAVLLATRPTPARSASTATPRSVARKLVGHWTGPKFGAEANRFRSDEWDLFFNRVSGPALIGRKRHRENSGRWSRFERIDAIVDSRRHIWAVDEDGTINGRLRANGRLEFVYLEPGTTDAAASVIRLRRR
jgi:hypothetical protein